MDTQQQPPPNPNRTFSQSDAAAIAGVSQRALVDRGNKKGYLPKLYYCFPGKFWELVAVGSMEEQRSLRLTSKGVEELKALIQNLSPEPPQLDDEGNVIRENGAVLKKRLPCPNYTLKQYAEYVWFSHQFDGAAEHQRIELEKKRKPDCDRTSQQAIDAELVDSGEIVSVNGSAEGLISSAFEYLSESDRIFWTEVERRKEQGKLMGRMLAAVTLAGMSEGEEEVTKEYYQKSGNVAQKRTGLSI